MWLWFVVGGAAALASGIRSWQRYWGVVDVPLSDAGHVFIGANAVSGRVRPMGDPFVSPITGRPCVWWRYRLQQLEESGRSASWRTRDEGVHEEPFCVEDASGQVLVVPAGMRPCAHDEQTLSPDEVPALVTVNALHRASTQVRHDYDGSLLGRFLGVDAGASSLGLLEGRWRIVEEGLRPGDQVFVQGQARMRSDGAAGVELAAPLSVRVGTREQAETTSQLVAMLGTVVGTGALVMAPGVALGHPGPQMGLAACGVALVLFVSYLIRVFNRLVRSRERAELAWSLISVATQRRAELVPQLGEAVGAAFANERTVQELVARTRAEVHAGRLPDAASLGGARDAARAGAELLALAEGSPELSSEPNAKALLDELRHTEDDVAFARRFYDDAVQILRDRTQTFPDRVVAPWVRMPHLELFQL